MFSLSPPAKVARTQRQSLSHSNGNSPLYASTHGFCGDRQVYPASIDEAVVRRGDQPPLSPADFLSGAGGHLCWAVDENTRLIRVWNLASPNWSRTAPRLADIPFFAAMEEGLPLFVSEMAPVEESLAFCSERGAVSSLDHSIEFQLLDQDDSSGSSGTSSGGGPVRASCFACQRMTDPAGVITTVVGTTTGLLLVDVKMDGEHLTRYFARATSSVRYDTFNKPHLAPSWWASLKSLLHGRSADERQVREKEDEEARSGVEQPGHVGKPMAYDDSYTEGDSAPSPTSHRASSTSAFTHVLFRKFYPDELIAANALGEVFLIPFGPLQQADGRPQLAPTQRKNKELSGFWATNIRAVLRDKLPRGGRIVGLAESRHKVVVLYLTQPDPRYSDSLPALVLLQLNTAYGHVVHIAQVSAIADVVRAAAEVPLSHIKLYVVDNRTEVIVLIKQFCLRVNLQSGARSPCSSEDTIVMQNVQRPLSSVLLEDDSVVTLDVDGPVVTIADVRAPLPAGQTGSVSNAALQINRDAMGDDADAERCVASLVAAARADGRVTLDEAVLNASDDLAEQRTTQRGNWARADLNADDENLIMHVTRQLRRRQQTHSRLVDAVVSKRGIVADLRPDTVVHLLAVEEALGGLMELRELLSASGSTARDVNSDFTVVLPHFTMRWGELLPSSGYGGSAMVSASSGSAPDTFAASVDEGNTNKSQVFAESPAQVERRREVLRRCILQVADYIRQSATTSTLARDGGVEDATAATAAELVFSRPAHLGAVLRAVRDYLLLVRQSAVMDGAEKLAEANAAASILERVARVILRVRLSYKDVYAGRLSVRDALWQTGLDAIMQAQHAFQQAPLLLSEVLADSVLVQNVNAPVPGGAGSAARGTAVQHSATADQLVLFQYMVTLVRFAFFHMPLSAAENDLPQAVRQTLLRAPFVKEPIGYPFGPLQPSRYAPELGKRALEQARWLGRHFRLYEVLYWFVLPSPVADPNSEPEAYNALKVACASDEALLRPLLERLLRDGREWELLFVPPLIQSEVPNAVAIRDAVLDSKAPHLLWLTQTDRYDVLAHEGSNTAPFMPFGSTAIAHRARCVALARLGWVASGASTASARYHGLELDEAIVVAQREYLTSSCDNMQLGPQQAVRALLAEEGNVGAWTAAAEIACRTQHTLCEDLLVEILRRCHDADGDALSRIAQDSVSELEMLRGLRRTATGRVVLSCAALQDPSALLRLCETVLNPREQQLLTSLIMTELSGDGDAVPPSAMQ